MAISIDWGTKVISVPKTFLSPVSGTLYELDSDTFRLALKDLEDDAEGMSHLPLVQSEKPPRYCRRAESVNRPDAVPAQTEPKA